MNPFDFNFRSHLLCYKSQRIFIIIQIHILLAITNDIIFIIEKHFLLHILILNSLIAHKFLIQIYQNIIEISVVILSMEMKDIPISWRNFCASWQWKLEKIRDLLRLFNIFNPYIHPTAYGWQRSSFREDLLNIF
jgi:hypothetical protein